MDAVAPPRGEDESLDKAVLRVEVALLTVFFFRGPIRVIASVLAFLLLGIIFPTLAVWLAREYGILRFEIFSIISHVLISASGTAVMCINLSKYNTVGLILGNRSAAEVSPDLRVKYTRSIEAILLRSILVTFVCYFPNIAKELWRFTEISKTSPGKAIGILTLNTFAWIYLITTFLSVCFLLTAICDLHLIDIEAIRQKLQTDINEEVFRDTLLLQKNMESMSLQFRYFILSFALVLLVQVLAVIDVTTYKRKPKAIEIVEFIVLAVMVPLVGMFASMIYATEVSRRAKVFSSEACKRLAVIIHDEQATNDLEGRGRTYTLPGGDLSSHILQSSRRLAIIAYFRSNTIGMQLFGWVVDRDLCKTYSLLQLTLLLFSLGYFR